MRNLAVVLTVVLLGLFVCSPQTEREAVTPEVDVEKAEQMARQLNEDWDAAFVSRDMEALLALYLDDAVRMQPDEPAWMGKAEIREGFERNWAQFFSVDVTNKDDDVLVLGDYVLVRGSSQATVVEEEGGEAIESTAKFLSLRQIQPDGSQKVVWDIWNRDAPLPTGEGTKAP
jgi:uncharacterized protein (TIGR02246 family)